MPDPAASSSAEATVDTPFGHDTMVPGIFPETEDEMAEALLGMTTTAYSPRVRASIIDGALRHWLSTRGHNLDFLAARCAGNPDCTTRTLTNLRLQDRFAGENNRALHQDEDHEGCLYGSTDSTSSRCLEIAREIARIADTHVHVDRSIRALDPPATAPTGTGRGI